jgi:hypothetical protein
MRLPFSNPIDYLGIGIALACQKTKAQPPQTPRCRAKWGRKWRLNRLCLAGQKQQNNDQARKKHPVLI